MSSAAYQKLPQSPPPDSPSGSRPASRLRPASAHPSPLSPDDPDQEPDAHRPLRASVQAEFNRPPPSWISRAALIAIMLFLGWASIRLGSGAWGGRKPEVIYASRYSEQYKYRPAASPIITETLKDGRLRIRGASLGGSGVRPEDVPKSPVQLQFEKEKMVKEAREAAKKRLGLKSRRKGRKSATSTVKSEI